MSAYIGNKVNSLTNPFFVNIKRNVFVLTTHFQYSIREVFTILCRSLNSITGIRWRREERAHWRLTDREESTKQHVKQPRTESIKVQNINPGVTFILLVAIALLLAIVAYI